jgi:hypothetical protein
LTRAIVPRLHRFEFLSRLQAALLTKAQEQGLFFSHAGGKEHVIHEQVRTRISTFEK